MSEDEIMAAIRAELRPGGRPTAAYLAAVAERNLATETAAVMSSAIFVNFEDRIVEIERRLGITDTSGL